MKDFTGNNLNTGDDVIFHLDFYGTHSLQLGVIHSIDEHYGQAVVKYNSQVGSPVVPETGERVWSTQENLEKVYSDEIYKR